VRALAKRYGVSPTTVQKWRKRSTTADARMGPREVRSTVLTREEEAIVVAFRRHTLLPLDDCLYGLQPTIPHLTRSSLHRCLERHGISRLPEMDGEWLTVPVPLHPFRLWRRGFNQSALLAREIARLRGASLVVDGLVRRKRTPVLGGLGKAARARALSGAIAVRPRCRPLLREAKVVLVDDVMTSGATSDACVGALKRSGAEKVVVACFARVLDEAL